MVRTGSLRGITRRVWVIVSVTATLAAHRSAEIAAYPAYRKKTVARIVAIVVFSLAGSERAAKRTVSGRVRRDRDTKLIYHTVRAVAASKTVVVAFSRVAVGVADDRAVVTAVSMDGWRGASLVTSRCVQVGGRASYMEQTAALDARITVAGVVNKAVERASVS